MLFILLNVCRTALFTQLNFSIFSNDNHFSQLFARSWTCPNLVKDLVRNELNFLFFTDIDGNFLCAADQDKIVIWNARNGKFIRSIAIPAHYDFREDKNERDDKYCWKGHTDFAFAEDGIIIIHSQRNFPIAADVMLFWWRIFVCQAFVVFVVR